MTWYKQAKWGDEPPKMTPEQMKAIREQFEAEKSRKNESFRARQIQEQTQTPEEEGFVKEKLKPLYDEWSMADWKRKSKIEKALLEEAKKIGLNSTEEVKQKIYDLKLTM